MATRTKGAGNVGPEMQSFVQVFSEVLTVIRRNAECFPRRVRRARLAISLASGERLEIELTGDDELEAALTAAPGDPRHAFEYAAAGFAGFKDIPDLQLRASAEAAAQKLLAQFPNDVKFTSGRRSISQQAAAMAENVVKNRNYIESTYRDTPERAQLQQWVDDHPAATKAPEIAAGLESVMNAWTPAQQQNISRHVTGDAFDIQPVAGPQGAKIKDAIKKLPKLNWYTFVEAGLPIWHAQFDV
ncbi:MAG: hypothetical protein IAE88_18965 [Rhodobacteraceae bacterium]|nr:hypothetical protein [Paracoccaceae bacterium]